ncbi:DUF4112 domain-containing protein [Azospirillum picis]|uniref:DUF4112 domain-containing protein n=1 Tax=Azospirillum picis TaxID=488438 RepID=A0ABU0MKB1_9PROT|nr:DUF4112 domain-containing protein [Azospirillum picis]MBP2299925.1 hypothetical protein [Azospirillum picis]MDQ0533837.1 hypothetical protein [Azospirillum picis]
MIDAIRARRRTVTHDPRPDQPGGLSPDDFQRLERLRRLTRLMDTRWRIPGTRIPIGLDGIASLVPVAGDTATAVVSAYLILEASRFGLPKSLIARMVFNVMLDWAGGSVPVIGTLFDVAFKANRMNLNLLHEHLEQRLAGAPARR